MGRRNWLFAWTELGANRAGAIRSLPATCQLQGVNPCIIHPGDLAEIQRMRCRFRYFVRFRTRSTAIHPDSAVR